MHRDSLSRVDTGTGPRSSLAWTWKSLLAGVFFITFLALQIAVPLVQLASPRPARFGWHMWTARKESPQFLVVLHDGTTRPADLSAHVGLSRGEMDLSDALPPHLCRVVLEIVAVEIRTPGSDAVKIYPCH